MLDLYELARRLNEEKLFVNSEKVSTLDKTECNFFFQFCKFLFSQILSLSDITLYLIKILKRGIREKV